MEKSHNNSKEKKSNILNPELDKETQHNLDEDKNLRSDGGDDEQLKNRKRPVDFEGKDLDVPGRDLPENRSKKQLKDEENQLYSQGGPGNENLEENV
ncbi:MAG: hypothetical protein ACSHXF_10540 [Aquaticitalea sp.]